MKLSLSNAQHGVANSCVASLVRGATLVRRAELTPMHAILETLGGTATRVCTLARVTTRVPAPRPLSRYFERGHIQRSDRTGYGQSPRTMLPAGSPERVIEPNERLDPRDADLELHRDHGHARPGYRHDVFEASHLTKYLFGGVPPPIVRPAAPTPLGMGLARGPWSR
jgi:hypothetical protein